MAQLIMELQKFFAAHGIKTYWLNVNELQPEFVEQLTREKPPLE